MATPRRYSGDDFVVLLWGDKPNGAKAHSSGGDKPPLRRKQR